MAMADDENKKYKRAMLKGLVLHLLMCALSLLASMCIVHNMVEAAKEHGTHLAPMAAVPIKS